MISPPKRIRSSVVDVQAVQDNLVETVEAVVRKEVLDGILLKDVSIGTSATPVEHRLGRVPLGYIIVSKNAAGDVYDTARDSKTITMQSSLAVVASLWVF